MRVAVGLIVVCCFGSIAFSVGCLFGWCGCLPICGFWLVGCWWWVFWLVWLVLLGDLLCFWLFVWCLVSVFLFGVDFGLWLIVLVYLLYLYCYV